MRVYKMFIPLGCPSNFISVLIFQVVITSFNYFLTMVITSLIQIVNILDFTQKTVKRFIKLLSSKGGASLDLNGVAPKPFRWILDITWLNLVEINKLAVFSAVLTKVGGQLLYKQ